MEEEFTFEQLLALRNAFCRDLRILFHKYKVSIESSDEYDGEENWCGTTDHFQFLGQTYHSESVKEIFDLIEYKGP